MRLSFMALMTSLLFSPHAMMQARGDDERWALIPTERAAPLFSIAEDALTTNWEQAGVGMCRATVRRDLATDETVELEVWWQKDRMRVRILEWPLLEKRSAKRFEGALQLGVYSPTEQWEFFATDGTLRGTGSKTQQTPKWGRDCRPRSVWLSWPFNANRTHLQTLRDIRSANGTVSRQPDGSLRFESMNFALEFTPTLLVRQFEMQTRLDQFAKPELALPVKCEYTLAVDAHGAHYCRRAVASVWPRGGNGKPTVTELLSVSKYDSQPSPDELRFTYETIGIPKGTIVTSTIPSRRGKWVYGRENEGSKPLDEAALRRAAEALRERGFAAPKTDD